jgi:hypothetical protein
MYWAHHHRFLDGIQQGKLLKIQSLNQFCKSRRNDEDKPTSQSAPANPDVQLQVFGATQVPLAQALTQIARDKIPNELKT